VHGHRARRAGTGAVARVVLAGMPAEADDDGHDPGDAEDEREAAEAPAAVEVAGPAPGRPVLDAAPAAFAVNVGSGLVVHGVHQAFAPLPRRPRSGAAPGGGHILAPPSAP